MAPPPPGRHSRTPELTRRLSASSNSTQSWTGYLDPSAASYTPNSSSLESAIGSGTGAYGVLLTLPTETGDGWTGREATVEFSPLFQKMTCWVGMDEKFCTGGFHILFATLKSNTNPLRGSQNVRLRLLGFATPELIFLVRHTDEVEEWADAEPFHSYFCATRPIHG